MKKKNSLGDRMKRYEKVSSPELYRRMPVICRVDGKAFHTFTKKIKCTKPYDVDLIAAMLYASHRVAEEMQGFKLGYVQSDEASFLITDYDNLETQPWFGHDLSKIVSISASIMSVYFNAWFGNFKNMSTYALFDSRAFQLPKDEVANYFVYRAKDWERNSLQMYARSVFSHKELMGKKKDDIHEMLHKEGRNWTKDVPPQEKNGTFFHKGEIGLINRIDILPTHATVSDLIETLV